MLSVICPIYNEEKYIAKCIESILNQDYPKDDLEVIFVDGMSTDKTRDIVNEYTYKYPFIKLIDNPQKIVPPAMNIGIRESKGEIIIRLDAHAEFPSQYFSRLTKALIDLKADNVGGVCITLPTSDDIIPIAIANVLSSKFGMGNSTFRVGCKDIQEVDTVPFGCWHRDIFEKIGYFDEELIRNQDDEFNGRTIKNGGHIYLLPDVEIKYFARDKISKVYKMFYQYGLFKPLVNKKLGSPATIRQFFPPIFVSGLLLGFILSLIFPILSIPYLSVICLYILLATYFSIKTSNNILVILTQIYIYFVVHIGYGLGYIKGMFNIFTKKGFNVNTNR